MVEAIRVDNVTKWLGKRGILKNVSFSVEQGDIFGYLGPNGSGKTTTVRILLNLLKPSFGSVTILGHDILKHAASAKMRIGFMLETDGLYETMSALDNLTYYGHLYGMSNPQRRARELLSLMQFGGRTNDKVSTYSKVMRQRLALARAMIHNPEILILDEPTATIDSTGQIEMHNLIMELAHEMGKTIFFSSHKLDEVQHICNRVALIDKGEIKLCGDLQKLRLERGLSKVVITTNEEEVSLEDMANELRSLPDINECNADGRCLVLQLSGEHSIPEIIYLLHQKEVHIEKVKKTQVSLEDIYASLAREDEATR